MYNGDLKWADLAQRAGATAETLQEALLHGLAEYNEWQSFRAGRTNAQIATALTALGPGTITEGQVAEMDACYAAFKVLHDCASNVAVPQGDRFFAMRVFS